VFRRRLKTPNHTWGLAGTFGSGIVLVYLGIALLHRGVVVYRNSYRAEVYSPALAATGVVLMLLALIPDWLVRWFVKRGDN